MTCETIRMPNGQAAIICGRGLRAPPKCSACGRPASLECDYPAPRRASGTCDKPLCGSCAVSVDKNLDHCPDHPVGQMALAL